MPPAGHAPRPRPTAAPAATGKFLHPRFTAPTGSGLYIQPLQSRSWWSPYRAGVPQELPGPRFVPRPPPADIQPGAPYGDREPDLEGGYSTGPQGEPLPPGAVAYDVRGEPYFGPGLGGALQHARYNLAKRTGAPLQPQVPLTARQFWFGEPGPVGRTLLSNLKNVDISPPGGAEFTPLKTVADYLGAGVDTGLDALGELARQAEGHVIGPTFLAREAAAEGSKVKALEFGDSTAADWAEGIVQNFTPVGAVNTIARIATAPPGRIQRITNADYDSARIAYSVAINPMLKAELRRRIDAGHDPELARRALENPIAELAGQIVFDPLNLVGVVVKPIRAARMLGRAENVYGAVDDIAGLAQAEKAVAAARAGGDTVEIGNTLRRYAEVQQATSKAAVARMKAVEAQRGIFSLTAASKQQELIDDVNALTQVVFRDRTITSAEELGRVWRAWAQLHSPDVDDVILATQELRRFGPIPFSPAGQNTGLFLREVLGGSEFDPELIGRMLKAAKTPTELAESISGLYVKTARKLFPSVKELRALEGGAPQLGAGVQAAAAFDESVGEGVRWVNRVLSQLYMGYSPAYAARNMVSGWTHLLDDYGPGIFKQKVIRDADVIADLGHLPPGVGGVGGPGGVVFTKGATGALTLPQAFKKGKFIGVSSEIERRLSLRVVYYAANQALDRMVQVGRAIPDTTPLVRAGMDAQAVDLLVARIRNTRNVADAVAWVKSSKTAANTLEVRRVLQLADAQRNALRDAGLLDDLVKAADEATDPDTFRRAVQAIRDEIGATAAKAADMPPVAHVDDPYIRTLRQELDAAGVTISDRAQEQVNLLANMTHTVRLNTRSALEEAAMTAAAKKPQRAAEFRTLANEGVERWESLLADREERIRQTVGQLMLRLRREVKGEEAKDRFFEDVVLATKNKMWTAWTDEAARLTDDYYRRLAELSGEASVTKSTERLMQTSRDLNAALQAAAPTGADPRETLAVIRGVQPVIRGQANRIRALANEYGVPTLTDAGKPNDRHLLNIINKGRTDRFAKLDDVPEAVAREALEARNVLTAEKVAAVPRNTLPPALSQNIELTARTLLDDLAAGEPGRRLFIEPGVGEGGVPQVVGQPSTLPDWYGEFLTQYRTNRKAVVTALQKIVDDVGRDKGVMVERLKAQILDELADGLVSGGTKLPPDPDALRLLGRSQDEIDRAVDAWRALGEEPVQEVPAAGARPFETPGEPAFIPEPAPAPAPRVAIPHPDAIPDPAFAARENADGLLKLLDQVESEHLARWDELADTSTLDRAGAALDRWAAEGETRMRTAKLVAGKYGTEARNFTLLNYGRRMNLDTALAYIYPYQFWYSRTYINWMKRIAMQPGVAAAYAKYRAALEKHHAGMPAWWKYNVNTNELLGLNSDNPLFFNLEQTLNPLQGMVGVDFNDKDRRRTWFSSLVDDAGKFGPTVWTPFHLAMAAYFGAKGDKDAALAWSGRVIPQTATLRSATALLGLGKGGAGIELDPSLLLQGGLDAYQRRRVGRALSTMIQAGEISREQGIDAAYTQTGPVWQEAIRQSIVARAPGQLAGAAIGAGFKGRSLSDVQIDRFYADMFAHMGRKSDLSPEEYQQGWADLKKAHPYADTLLLSRKGGIERDEGLTWSVLNRIPPAQGDDMAKMVGLDNKLLNKWYEDGGLENFSDTDRVRFMAAMIDLGAILALPPDATAREWNGARSDYKQLSRIALDRFGANIEDMAEGYFALEGDARKAYLEKFPIVDQYLDWKDAYILAHPRLSKYYGGVEMLERYYKTEMYAESEKRFGEDIFDVQTAYYEIKDQDGNHRGYLRDHPQLREYWDYLHAAKELVAARLAEFGPKLPKPEKPAIRPDADPAQSLAAQDVLAGLYEASAESGGPFAAQVSADILKYTGSRSSPGAGVVSSVGSRQSGGGGGGGYTRRSAGGARASGAPAPVSVETPPAPWSFYQRSMSAPLYRQLLDYFLLARAMEQGALGELTRLWELLGKPGGSLDAFIETLKTSFMQSGPAAGAALPARVPLPVFAPVP